MLFEVPVTMEVYDTELHLLAPTYLGHLVCFLAQGSSLNSGNFSVLKMRDRVLYSLRLQAYPRISV